MKNALQLYVIVNFLSIVTSKRLSFFVTRVFVATLHGLYEFMPKGDQEVYHKTASRLIIYGFHLLSIRG